MGILTDRKNLNRYAEHMSPELKSLALNVADLLSTDDMEFSPPELEDEVWLYLRIRSGGYYLRIDESGSLIRICFNYPKAGYTGIYRSSLTLLLHESEEFPFYEVPVQSHFEDVEGVRETIKVAGDLVAARPWKEMKSAAIQDFRARIFLPYFRGEMMKCGFPAHDTIILTEKFDAK